MSVFTTILGLATALGFGSHYATSAPLDTLLPQRGCAVHHDTAQLAGAEADFLSLLQSNPVSSNLDTVLPPIEVVWHVVYRNATRDQGYLDFEGVNKSIVAMNDHYAGSGISFVLKGDVNWVQNANWYSLGPNGGAETDMKNTLRVGDQKVLNVYSAALAGSYLGWASFPSDYTSRPYYDGVVIHYESIPGGNYWLYDEGKTLTHEVGHWLGLYHVFQGGCDEPGDYVNDTAPQWLPTSYCPESPPESCSPGLYDSVHNYMDYSIDSCMTEFTPGQVERAKQQIALYRGIV